MVIVNRIINILILLAAIAAVVFSYLLFSKREKLINGWAQMATAINTAAKTLDDGGNSGTSAAKDLPEDKLKHENYDQLGSVLPKLKENAGKIVAQRNELAETMQKAASRLEIQNVESKNLKNVSAYKDQQRIFFNGVQDFRRNRDSVSSEYSKTFRLFGASVSSSDLNNPKKFRSAISTGNMKVKDVVDRKNQYASSLEDISDALELPKPQIQGAAYASELKKIADGARKKTKELKSTQSQLAAAKRRNQALENQIAGHQKTIKSKNLSLQEKEKQIKHLNDVLTKDGSIKLQEPLLTPSDPGCYKYVRGVIEYVDKDYGFVQINIGSSYTFVQHYGTAKNPVHFPLKTGKIMSVVRNLGTEHQQFIGKVMVTKVEEKSSICNLIGGRPELYQVGDSVYFSDEDMAVATGKKNAPKK